MSVIPRRALIVIDVQNEYITGELPIEYPNVLDSLANIGRVMDAALAASIPIIVVQHTLPEGAPVFAKGSLGWELNDIVRERAHSHCIEKTLPSAFAGTDLAEWLSRHRVDTITVVGYMTHNCNDSTIKHAQNLGLAAEFIADAAGSLAYKNQAGGASAEEIHRAFTVVMQSNFAAVATTDEWIAALQTGQALRRDNIYASNRRARGAANAFSHQASEHFSGKAVSMP